MIIRTHYAESVEVKTTRKDGRAVLVMSDKLGRVWIAPTPKQLRRIAAMLVKAADKIEKGKR